MSSAGSGTTATCPERPWGHLESAARNGHSAFLYQHEVVQVFDAHDTALELARAVLANLPILENGIPEKAHEGSCIAGITGCDASCAEHATACEAFAETHRLATRLLEQAGEK